MAKFKLSFANFFSVAVYVIRLQNTAVYSLPIVPNNDIGQ